MINCSRVFKNKQQSRNASFRRWAMAKQAASLRKDWSPNIFLYSVWVSRIIGWFGLKRTLKII